MKTYYVYIMTNNSRTLYTGVTNDLERRVFEHKHKLLPGFTRQYNINRLVCYESCGDIRAAIQREKQIKGWVRAKKVALILSANHAWRDLSEGWHGKDNCRDSSFVLGKGYGNEFCSGFNILGNGFTCLKGALKEAPDRIFGHAPCLGEGFTEGADFGDGRDHNAVAALGHALIDNSVAVFAGGMLFPVGS